MIGYQRKKEFQKHDRRWHTDLLWHRPLTNTRRVWRRLLSDMRRRCVTPCADLCRRPSRPYTFNTRSLHSHVRLRTV